MAIFLATMAALIAAFVLGWWLRGRREREMLRRRDVFLTQLQGQLDDKMRIARNNPP